MKPNDDEPEIRTDLRPGDLGRIVMLHGELYAAEHGLDPTFEPYVAGPLAEFALRSDPRERIWVVDRRGRAAGSVAVVAAAPDAAQLRWLLLHPDLRGRGLGRRLTAGAVDFARRRGYRTVLLWTLGHLSAAVGIYRRLGFVLAERHERRLWGRDLVEEKYTLDL